MRGEQLGRSHGKLAIRGFERTMTLGERLRMHWTRTMSPPAGASEQCLLEFEARHGVRFPADMRDYLLSVDGMGKREVMDDELFTFWPLREIVCAADYFDDEFLDEQASYFLFADHSTNLPAYAIELTNDIAGRHWVIAIYSDMRNYEAEIVADSFTEFVERYLADKDSREDLGMGMSKEGYGPLWVRSF